MILITGATGNLGSTVVDQLLKTLDKNQFIVTSSNENGVEKLKNKGLNARLANFSEPATLDLAFQGITKLLLISTMDQNRFEQHKNVIDAAKKAGVQQIVYTSLAIKDIETSGVKALMNSHFETEEYLIKSGLNYVIFRNTMYAEALSQILGFDENLPDIYLPGGDGKVPYALRHEMGEAIANLLLDDNQQNAIYNITGSKAYSYADLAEELSLLTSKKIAYHDISEEELQTALQSKGFPDFAIYLHSGTIADIKNHQYEIIEKSLEDLLKRKPADAAVFLKEVFKLN